MLATRLTWHFNIYMYTSSVSDVDIIANVFVSVDFHVVIFAYPQATLKYFHIIENIVNCFIFFTHIININMNYNLHK